VRGQGLRVLAHDLEIRGQRPVLDQDQHLVEDLGEIEVDGGERGRPRIFEK
jgi:hypothetical protein